MLFDCHEDLIRRLAKEARVGKRDVEIRTVKLGPNEVSFVSAKTEEGLEFVNELEEKLPMIDVSDYIDVDELEKGDDGDDDAPDDDEEE